jgi:hypothetical protein
VSQIALFSGADGPRGEAERLPITYNGLILNDPDDEPDDIYELNVVAGNTSFDYVSEVNQQRDGLEFYRPRRVSRIETLKGTLRAQSQAAYHDKVKALLNAFDPVQVAHDNDPAYLQDPISMFIPLDFSVPTLDTANYASGLVPSRYYALPLRLPEPIMSQDNGWAAFFDLVMLIRDPRRYWQTLTTTSGNATIDNSLADVASWPTLSITMSGAGSATFTVTNTTTSHGTQSLVLDLSSLATGNTVTVDFERRKITKTVSGTTSSFASAYISGPYFEIDAGSNEISYSNTTNTSSRSISFRRAWSA